MNNIVIKHSDQNWLVGFDKTKATGVKPIESKSPQEAVFQRAIYKQLSKEHGDGFVIAAIKPLNGERAFNLQIVFEDGLSKEVKVSLRDIMEELNLKGASHLAFKISTEDEGFKNPFFQDGFSMAATAYFQVEQKKELKIPRKLRYLSPMPRVAVQGDQVILTRRGLSRIEQVFARIFRPAFYAEWMGQNRQTIEVFQKFLINECGQEKVSQIEKTFGFSLSQMKEKGAPLLPIYVYYFNIGMNDIEMDDVARFANKLKTHFFSLDPKMSASKFFTNQTVFSNREIRGMLANASIIGEIQKRFENLKNASCIDDLDASTFNDLVEALMTPKSDWEKAYTGRKFNAAITGAYNTEVGSYKKFRPWIDMQELAQVHFEIRDHASSNTDHVFNEYLVKVAVKKHLMRSTSDGEWRVGTLIPSPYKDAQGKTIWYRVEEGVDSAFGKYWIVFKPANPKYEEKYPVIRVNRDTCTTRYSQRAGPTISRDLARDAGYKFSHTSEEEDSAFFSQFTLPVWMAYLADGAKKLEVIERTQKGNFEELREQFRGALEAYQMDHPEDRGFIIELHNAFEYHMLYPSLETSQNFLKLLNNKVPASSQDRQLLADLLEGRKPRAVRLLGTSLGGFDAQHDLVRETAKKNRIPITDLKLYTHSTLKIGEEDNETFVNFMKEHSGLAKSLDTSLSIDHITEKDDIVSQFGADRTFLGRGLPSKQISFRVFETIKTSQSPQITDLPIHIRRIEHLKEGIDIKFTDYTIEGYEKYSNERKFLKHTLDWWHNVANKVGLSTLADKIWKVYRYATKPIIGMTKETRNQKLVVNLNEYRFSRVSRQNSPTRLKSRSLSETKLKS